MLRMAPRQRLTSSNDIEQCAPMRHYAKGGLTPWYVMMRGRRHRCHRAPGRRCTQVIPVVVTGRAIVYEWKCTNGVPEIMRQFAQPDAQGVLSHILYAV